MTNEPKSNIGKLHKIRLFCKQQRRLFDPDGELRRRVQVLQKQFEWDRERAARKNEEKSAVISEGSVYIQSEKSPSGGESPEIGEQELMDMYINGRQKEGESNEE